MNHVVYTDGASSKSGDGGFAWVEPASGLYGAGFVALTTNQRMEMLAVLRAMEYFDAASGLTIISDSAYVVNCWKDRWYDKWNDNGWRNSKNKPVLNADLWVPIVEHWMLRPWITLVHVRGHSGDPGNDLADRLAVRAKHERLIYRIRNVKGARRM